MPFEVFPAIDLIGGRCVRLYQGDYQKETVYADDPVSVALRWEDEGARWLHVVDLDGARDGKPVQRDILRRIAAAVTIPVQFGGGLRDQAAIQTALEAGASRVVIGTAALDGDIATSLCRQFGERLALGLDARNGRVAIRGWTEDSGRGVVETASALERAGARRIIFTEITRDGTLDGPAVGPTRELAEALGIPVLASGGVGKLADLEALSCLEAVGVEGVIVGRALYTGDVDLRAWNARSPKSRPHAGDQAYPGS